MTEGTHPPDEDAAALARAETYLDIGRPQEALRLAGSVLARDPSSVPAMRLLYRSHAALDQHAEALRMTERMVLAAPDDAGCWALHARALSSARRWKPSLASASTALQLDPGSVHVMHVAGSVYLDAGQPDRARELLTTALRRAPDDPGLLVSLADVHQATGALDEARRALETALSVSPDHAAALRAKANLDYASGLRVEATLDLAKRFAAAPQDSDTENAFEIATGGFLVLPAALTVVAAVAMGAVQLVASGLGFDSGVLRLLALKSVEAVLLLLLVGVIALWWRRTAARFPAGMLKRLALNRLEDGFSLTVSLGVCGLAAVLLVVACALCGFLPVTTVVLAIAAACSALGGLVIPLTLRILVSGTRRGKRAVLAVAIVLCVPGAVVAAAGIVVGLAVAFVYSVVYVFVPRGKLPMPFWWGGKDVTAED